MTLGRTQCEPDAPDRNGEGCSTGMEGIGTAGLFRTTHLVIQVEQWGIVQSMLWDILRYRFWHSLLHGGVKKEMCEPTHKVT